MIKTVWFDLGNVIIPFNFEPAFKQIAKFAGTSSKKIHQFFLDRPNLVVQSDQGSLTSYQLYQLLKQSFPLGGLSYVRFKIIWNNIFRPNKGVIALIGALKKKGYRLVLISNTNKLHFDFLKKQYSVLKKFDKRILSYQLKTRKPKPQIYNKALKHSKAKANEIFYIDDIPEMTRAASKNHGVHSHTFKTATGLKKALRSRGVQF